MAGDRRLGWILTVLLDIITFNLYIFSKLCIHTYFVWRQNLANFSTKCKIFFFTCWDYFLVFYWKNCPRIIKISNLKLVFDLCLTFLWRQLKDLFGVFLWCLLLTLCRYVPLQFHMHVKVGVNVNHVCVCVYLSVGV